MNFFYSGYNIVIMRPKIKFKNIKCNIEAVRQSSKRRHNTQPKKKSSEAS